MTRGRAAGLAVLVLGLLAWRLFRAGSGEGDRPEGPGVGVSTVSHIDTQDGKEVPVPRVKEGGRPAGAADPGSPVRPATNAAPEEFLEGTCVLEDGSPLQGVLLSMGVSVELKGGSYFARSGPDGAFRWKKPAPPGSLDAIYLLETEVVLVSVEGGTIRREPDKSPATVVLPGTGPLRLVFRDNAGVAHVRLVNADSMEPVTKVQGLKVLWHVAGGWLSMGYGEDQAPGGWIPIPEGRLPETGPGGERAGISVDFSKVEVEFAMPGFEKGRLPLPDIKGRMEIRVRPVPPDATGEILNPIVVDSHDRGDPWVSATLRWNGPDPAPRTADVLGLPIAPGRFSLYDLPDGPWVIEIASVVDNTVVRGKKAFERHGGTVDLGTIELVPAGRVVIRVIDTANEPIPQAWAVIVRPEENPDQGRRLDLNQRGEVAVGDLEPGIGHRVVVKGLPRDLEQTVVAAADAKPVEFKWTEKLVPCRITLIVDGKAVANPDGRTTIPAVMQDSPLPRDKGAWKADGTFEAKLVPGTYKFSALATPKEGGDLALFSGEVTVPSGDSYEVRLELQRGGK